jgi:DDE family transposase
MPHPRRGVQRLCLGGPRPHEPARPVPAHVDATPTPLYETILDWIVERLRARGFSLPTCKRLALLICGLTISPTLTQGHLASSLHGLALSPTKQESIAHRLSDLLGEPDLDPVRLLPALFADLLPTLLQSVLASHRANAATAPFHHRRFPHLRIVVDATSKADQVHILVAGLPYWGIVLPLAVRVWEQNAPLEEGDYWLQLSGLLHDVQALLPPPLRDHLVLCADRFFGIPRMLDLCRLFGWSWLLRCQGQTRILRADGTVIQARELAPQRGDFHVSPMGADRAAADTPVAAFQEAGWRSSSLVAYWAPDAAEPWLLLTNLPPTPERLRDYAGRWAIERLFLTWKSHGWDLEASQIRHPARLGRLLSGLVGATLWCLSVAIAQTTPLLDNLAHRSRQRREATYQMRLPPATKTARPWPAKFSLLTWGRFVVHETAVRFRTPSLHWSFPDWDGPAWSRLCLEVYHDST